jgi:hypothetical protein
VLSSQPHFPPTRLRAASKHALKILSSSSPALQFSFEGFVEDGGQQGVELGGGFGLQFLERIHLGLKAVEVGQDAALTVATACVFPKRMVLIYRSYVVPCAVRK